jgi:hypothetical protein
VDREDALQAWLSSRGEHRKQDAGEVYGARDGQDCPFYDRAVDRAFAELGVELAALV